MAIGFLIGFIVSFWLCLFLYFVVVYSCFVLFSFCSQLFFVVVFVLLLLLFCGVFNNRLILEYF